MIKSLFFILIYLASVCTCFSQENTLVLPDLGQSIKAIIPSNWKILDKAEGDLNFDGVNDLAFVIQDTDSSYIEKNTKGIGVKTINSNPRTLAIYFKNKNAYLKQFQSNTFVVHRANPTMMEPFGGLIISDETIDIFFHIWFNAGSWARTIHHFIFKYINGKFRLVQYKRFKVMRNTGDFENTNLSFLTDSLIIKKGNVSSDSTKTVVAKQIQNDSLQTLESIKKPFNWDGK